MTKLDAQLRIQQLIYIQEACHLTDAEMDLTDREICNLVCKFGLPDYTEEEFPEC